MIDDIILFLIRATYTIKRATTWYADGNEGGYIGITAAYKLAKIIYP